MLTATKLEPEPEVEEVEIVDEIEEVEEAEEAQPKPEPEPNVVNVPNIEIQGHWEACTQGKDVFRSVSEEYIIDSLIGLFPDIEEKLAQCQASDSKEMGLVQMRVRWVTG